MTLYAATKNAGKLKEFAECARGAGIEVLALPGLPDMPEPLEDAASFMGNAELKAVAYSRLTLTSGRRGLLVFADDSGLEIDALGGQPGVRSARFADDVDFEPGQGSRDDRNNRLVLSLLQQTPETREGRSTRAARFVCALALARDGAIILRAEGEVEGQIRPAPRGKDGFGYDPLFLVPALGRTMAELSPDEKWALSHRGNAFRELLRQLANSHK
ncbi:MAG TPA: non-canonical purine NTP pyrophosphatase [Acidobacteriaceae bacterium]